MDLTVYLERTVRYLTGHHKCPQGTVLRQASRNVVTAVITAISRLEKLPLLMQLRSDPETLQVLLRMVTHSAPRPRPTAAAGGTTRRSAPERTCRWRRDSRQDPHSP
jgi:hypothetical protein